METSVLNREPSVALSDLRRHMLADGFDMVVDISKSEQFRLYDAKRNALFLDFFACFATIPLGYNHPRLTSQEAIDRLGRVAINKLTNSDVYSWEMIEFVDTFSRVAKPDFLKYAFFISGGTLAVENCLKAAFDWKVQKNLNKGISGEKGSQVIHFREAFHGRSGYTLSLTNTDPAKTRHFPKFNWPRIHNPACLFPLNDENLAKVREEEQQALKQILAAIHDNPDDIACIILEPIQCEGGDRYFRPEFHREIRSICDQHDILMVYDEVQTGFGSTGRFWGFEHYVRPDLLAFGKKSQICGVLASGRMDEVPKNVFHVSSRINSTWGGNLVDMVRCSTYLKIFEEERILEQVANNGKRLLAGLVELQEEFPQLVSNARGLGLLCAFDLPSPEMRTEFRRRLFQNRLLILGCGPRSIRLRTALNMPWEVMEEGLSILRKTLAEVRESL